MTKREAIATARSYELENSSWDESMKMWQQVNLYPGADHRSELKKRRIERALIILGVDSYDANQFAYGPDCYGVGFREAVYRY